MITAGSSTLIATSRFSFVSRARYTFPIPPSPRSDRISNGPRRVPGVSVVGGKSGRCYRDWAREVGKAAERPLVTEERSGLRVLHGNGTEMPRAEVLSCEDVSALQSLTVLPSHRYQTGF